jgi:hypothetical protein
MGRHWNDLAGLALRRARLHRCNVSDMGHPVKFVPVREMWHRGSDLGQQSAVSTQTLTSAVRRLSRFGLFALPGPPPWQAPQSAR